MKLGIDHDDDEIFASIFLAMHTNKFKNEMITKSLDTVILVLWDILVDV